MKRSDIDWTKLQIWLGMFALIGLFWYGVYLTGYLGHVIGFILMILSGFFAWESTMIVDERNKRRRKTGRYYD
tara:strand:- start:3036 stop:3254 length:219 start_codon:yes stop_codon:yes gene_type:complete